MTAAMIDRVPAREREFAEQYPRYYAALMALGPTNDARAAALGISLRQLYYLKQGLVWLRTSDLEARPELAQAWYEDVSAIFRKQAA